MPPKKRYQWNMADDGTEELYISRSQKKRDSTALQTMGEELAGLSPAVLTSMPLTPNILAAIREWQKLTSREGRRRQMQFIGRLMREEGDREAIHEALERHKAGLTIGTVSFKKWEKLRDDLMEAESPEVVNELLSPFSEEEAATLRDLLDKAKNEREHGRPPKAFRALFRQLRDHDQE